MPSMDIDINIDTNNAEAIQEAIDKLEELKAQAEDVSTSIEEVDSSSITELGEASDEASSSANELSNSLDDVNGEALKETSASAEELRDSLSGAKGSADGLGDSMSVLEGGMLLGVGEQIGGMANGLEGTAQAMDNASISVGQLAKETGVAEPQMVDLINNISNVTFPNDEAMQYVQALNQMGVASEDLGASATNMDRINDAFHLGSSDVVKLTQGLRAVGVDSNNLESSFNALAYSQSNVSGGVKTYSMVLQRQGALLSEYGYSADQVAVMLGQLSAKGLSQRQITSQLSQAMKEADGDSRKLEEALGLQAGSLDNASTTTSKYEGELMNLANEEMEHKTITQQLGAVWEDMSLKLSGVLSPLSSVGGMIGQLGSVGTTLRGLREIGNSMRDVTTAINIMRNAESVSAGIKTIFTTALGLETVAEEANATAKEANAVATDTETVSNEASLSAKLSATLANWGLAASESAVLLPLLLLVGAIIAVVAVLWYLYNNNETVRQSIDNLIQQFQLFIAKLIVVKNIIVAFVSSAIQRFTFWKNRASGEATGLVNSVYTTLTSLPSKVSSAVSGITGILTKPFTDAWNTISPLINKIGDGLNSLNPTSWFGVEYEGFNSAEAVSYEGFNTPSTLNNALNNVVSNSNETIVFNNEFNGIIEESASEYIVKSMNDYIKKQNLIRGV